MMEILLRVAENLGDRLTGPLHLRFMLQPLVAAGFGLFDGIKDARAGRPPYVWGLFTEPKQRPQMLRDGWRSVGKVFILAFLLDATYQLIVQRHVLLGETVIVAASLALVPYAIVRGLTGRLAPKAPRAIAPDPR